MQKIILVFPLFAYFERTFRKNRPVGRSNEAERGTFGSSFESVDDSVRKFFVEQIAVDADADAELVSAAVQFGALIPPG